MSHFPFSTYSPSLFLFLTPSLSLSDDDNTMWKGPWKEIFNCCLISYNIHHHVVVFLMTWWGGEGGRLKLKLRKRVLKFFCNTHTHTLSIRKHKKKMSCLCQKKKLDEKILMRKWVEKERNGKSWTCLWNTPCLKHPLREGKFYKIKF